MSQYFEVGDTVLWNPANGVAYLFLRSVEAVAPLVGLPTGIGPMIADEYEIDVPALTAFVDALVSRYRSSTHPILRALVEDVAALGVVLVERAGGQVPALSADAPPVDTRDVRVTTAGLGAVGDAAHLRALADEFGQSMPR